MLQIGAMRTKANNKNGARLKPSIECHFRLYDEHDRTLVLHIQREARLNERSIQQQMRFMLRQASEVPNAR